MKSALIASFILFSTSGFAGDSLEVGALTLPSKDVTLSFVFPGEIVKTLVKEGDFVKKNDPLAQQDDQIAQISLSKLELEKNEAESRLESIKKAAKRNAVSPMELDKAHLKLKMAQLQIQETKLRMAKMTLKSPFDGTIEMIDVGEGEVVDKAQPVLRLVKTDFLWIDAAIPLHTAKKLTLNQEILTQFDDNKSATVTGRIIHIAKIADAGSETLIVRIEIPNKSSRPAGEHITVLFKNKIK